MKVAVFSTHVLWITHYETELEIIQNHIDAGDDIVHYTCQKNLQHCELIFPYVEKEGKKYKDIQKELCRKCVAKQNKGINLLSRAINKEELLPAEWSAKFKEIPDDSFFENYDSLKKLTIDNYDVGWSLLSSLVSQTRNPNVNLSEYKKQLVTNYQESVAIYYRAIDQINLHKFDRVYVFNGRLSYTKALFRAAQKCGVDCYLMERGSTYKKYALLKNHTIHNISKFKENALELWESEPNEAKKRQISNDFYENRRKGIIGSWHSMTQAQKEGLLPENWDFSKKNICYFSSSDDEFISIDDSWKNPYFENQLEIIEYLCAMMKSDAFENHHLYVRVHPNANELGEAYVNRLMQFDNNVNITILHPTSSVSSYALLDAAEVVVTMGSTIGYEAVYAKKYTIQLGKSLYYDLEGPINPKNKEEIESLILNSHQRQVPLETIILGYYMNSYGLDFKYYQPLDYMNGSFKNMDLNFEPYVKPTFAKKVLLKLKITARKITERIKAQ